VSYRIAAVIVSAGLSSRMGRFKPLLPFGDQTAVAIVIRAFATCRVAPVVVVGGHRFGDLQKVVTNTTAICTYNPNFWQGMFSSFKHGIGRLPKNINAFFAHPVDMPLIFPQVVPRMLKAFEQQPGTVIYPCYQGAPGRPVLIPADLIVEILASDDRGGLRAILNAHSERFRFVEVTHPGILEDMDELADYQRLRALYEETSAYWD
jgi:CTP:molybdopterin cytidylyltransferase MocA